MTSLRARLLASLSLALVLAFAALAWLGGRGLGALLEDYVAARLEHDLEGVLAAVARGADGAPVLDERRLDPVFHRPLSGHYYVVQGGGRTLRSRSLWDAELALPDALPTGRLHLPGPAGQRLLAVGGDYRKQGMTLTVLVAEDLMPVEAALAGLTRRLALAAAAAAALVLALQGWIVGRALAPLRAAAEAVRRLRDGADGVPDPARAPAEIRPLLAEIGRLVALLRERLARSRSAIGDLAHALKTPLAVARRALADPELAGSAAARELAAQLDAIETRITRELRRARIAGHPEPGRRVLLAPEVHELAALVQRMHGRDDLAVELALPPRCAFAGDRDDLVELLGNLLDNAVRWARRRVRVEARQEAARLVLRIEDDGPGIEPQATQALARRGRRADEAAPGHGLGLAIVADIVGHYGGRLRLAPSAALGGLAVEVELPAA
ncbi:sensor histidine kinase [Inmirania thermothiophila]|uniref:histidine kinase n=1 Tax=Inmirania thermothiophila TaxID=1750597 RepID=A0A3N1Y808_9GAMM|nr:sensor histidine kinase [Inmirania thermothiophila]ROR34638.1 signal transduction histidine kinase [Inmirania thermothiophila]